MVGSFHGMLLLSAKCSRPLGDGKTPYERRFGEPLKGPIILFGALLEYHPISPKRPSKNSSIVQGSHLQREEILYEKSDLHNFLERKADQAFKGECAKLSEAQSELDRREWYAEC